MHGSASFIGGGFFDLEDGNWRVGSIRGEVGSIHTEVGSIRTKVERISQKVGSKRKWFSG